VASTVETKGEYRVLVGRPEVKRPLGRTRRRQNNNIHVSLQEMRWIDQAQGRDRRRALVNAVMNFQIP
jgi:hypothetical protein